MKKVLFILTTIILATTISCSDEDPVTIKSDVHQKDDPISPLTPIWVLIKVIVAKIPPGQLLAPNYAGPCLTGPGYCTVGAPKKLSVTSMNDVTEINEFTALEAVNTEESVNIIIDVIDENYARIWISSDLTYLPYSFDEYQTWSMDEVEAGDIVLHKGDYNREIIGNYFTYKVPYTVLK